MAKQGRVFQQVWKDSFVRVFLLLFILLHIPYFLTFYSVEQLETYDWLLSTVFLLPFVVVALWPFQQKSLARHELYFWRSLSIAFALWWVVSLINLLWVTGVWTKSLDVTADTFYLGFYVCWFAALSFAPHDLSPQRVERSDRWLLGTGAVVLALFLFSYFILVPSRYTPESYATWIPSLLFFSFLDIILAIALLRRTLKARAQRWSVLYGLLTLSMFLFAMLDLLEALGYATRFNWAQLPASDILWDIPLLLMIVVARARGFTYPQTAPDPAPTGTGRELPTTTFSPIILLAFILPVLHIGLLQLGLIKGLLGPPLGAVVLSSLGAFWILALAENRSLRRLSRQARVTAAENERLRVLQKVSEETARAKNRFLANVSHELRTPMNGIMGMIEIILRGPLAQEQRDQANLVLKSAQGLLNVIDDILTHSRLETGELTFTQEPFNLKVLAGKILDLFRPTTRQDDVRMNLEFEDDMPTALIGDASRLREVLLKLIGNAQKFTHKGEINIRFSQRGLSGSKVMIHCEVNDTGIGIDPGIADHILMPFSQVDESTSRKYGGSGLGLAITKKIVEAQSGELGFSSTPGRGSTFWFDIPYTPDPETEKAGEPEKPSRSDFALAEGERILLAEDNEINQIVAVKQLETLGKVVDVAANGNEVLEALSKQRYSLILMDCQMPEVDGIEATRRVREAGYSKAELPIVALTAHVLDEDRAKCLDAGMNDFLSKPLSLERLRETLVNWL